jgi:hypothetical protein
MSLIRVFAVGARRRRIGGMLAASRAQMLIENGARYTAVYRSNLTDVPLDSRSGGARAMIGTSITAPLPV